MTQKTFMQAFNGKLSGILRWHQLDTLWSRLRARPDQEWYLYAVGEAPPQEPVTGGQLQQFIDELDALLRKDHDEAYCGIVYVDDPDEPGMIKVYDPNNLGAVCGSSGARVLPGWVLSTMPPEDLQAALPPPGNRRRWWRRLFPG